MAAGTERDPVDELRDRLRQYTADRHPLQHATAQFHLGTVLLARGALDEAEEAFTLAAGIFELRGAKAERGKALNGLGATLRAAGRLELATRAFGHAVVGLAAAGLPLDEGAAHFNLGLVLRDSGEHAAAAAAFARAAERLDPQIVPAQAAAAARELGATQLDLDDPAAAEATLVTALDLADRAGDHPGRAAAANGLGLARLALGQPAEAADAFRTAVAASPRSLRPDAFAMAKANLALAYEGGGELARAALAARQAASAPEAPEPVRAQAAAVLGRIPQDALALATVLAEGTPEDRERLVREELLRTMGAQPAERVADMGEWITAHLTGDLEPVDVAEAWLGGLLELPSEGLDALVRSTLQALRDVGDEDAGTFRAAVSRAMARFHIPQWMRLQDVFARAADEVGDAGPWR